MKSTISDRLRMTAEVLDRAGINQDGIISVDVYDGEIRVHLENVTFFRSFSSPFEFKHHKGGEKMSVSRSIDGVTFFCVADAQTQKVA